MIKTTIEKLAEPIGFEIGASDDITQSSLLNGFCRGLYNTILNKNKLELQCGYIVENLDENAKNIILELTEFIKLSKRK